MDTWGPGDYSWWMRDETGLRVGDNLHALRGLEGLGLGDLEMGEILQLRLTLTLGQ